MAMLDKLCTEDNLLRAWRWIKSNPDASYKRYFRQYYGVYAVADISLIKNLRDHLRRDIYVPTKACKLFFPKPSGILRPYSLLTIEDQIVYQAAVNLVAEKLLPKVRRRYYEEVFGHLYAGKTSIWFYRKWSKGYKAFNDAAREAFSEGFKYAASFDLTACYDSLDHGVLRHFLVDAGCDVEFAEKLIGWLSVWTATDHGVYHNHGIPQGPLSSGLLSEVVLRHFDDHRKDESRVRYFRYVDDIKLFAESEQDLRRMLVRLDLLSKDIGLFPQASKISIHEVKDIETELKSVSHPTESSIRGKIVNQERLRKRLVKLTPQFRVSDPTRFKYLLAHAKPNSTIMQRLWRIFQNQPEYYEAIARYLERYNKFPRKTAERLIQEIKQQELYPAIRARLFNAAHDRLDDADARKVARFAKKLWKTSDMQPDLVAAIGRWVMTHGLLTVTQTKCSCKGAKSWWARAELVGTLNPGNTAGNTLRQVLNDALRDSDTEVALSAVVGLVVHEVPIARPLGKVNLPARLVLKELGLVRRSGSRLCGIDASFRRMLGKVPAIKWKSVFKKNYAQAERQAVMCRAKADTDVSAWVNAMDVFDDLLLNALYRHDRSLGKYTLGNIGSVLNGGRLQISYPAIYSLAEDMHARRLESALSHPTVKKTGQPTKVIRYSYLKKAKPLIRAALAELAAKW